MVFFHYLVKKDEVGTIRLVIQWYQGPRFISFFCPEIWFSSSLLQASYCTSSHPLHIPTGRRGKGKGTKGHFSYAYPLKKIVLETLPNFTYLSLARTKFHGHFICRRVFECIYFSWAHRPLDQNILFLMKRGRMNTA